MIDTKSPVWKEVRKALIARMDKYKTELWEGAIQRDPGHDNMRRARINELHDFLEETEKQQ